ncbi:MAG: LysR family transcriptional regulator substrate-binding protein, partial [Clostridia bacterium]
LKFSKMSRRILRHFGITPNVVYETTNWDTVCMLVAKGIGVGFLPEVLIHMHVHEPNFYRIAGIDSTRIYAVVYAKGKHLSHAALKLIDIFVENLKHMGHS